MVVLISVFVFAFKILFGSVLVVFNVFVCETSSLFLSLLHGAADRWSTAWS